MKKILTLLLGIIFLSSCTGADETGLIKSTRTYETANFKIDYPLDWEVIDRARFEKEIPENIVVGFRTNIKNEVFTTNVNISIDIFEKEVKPKDFAFSTLSLASKELVDFKEIQIGETTVSINEIKQLAYYIEYEGRASAKDPNINFRQVFASKGPVVYSITRASLPSENESIVNMANLMLNSFTLK